MQDLNKNLERRHLMERIGFSEKEIADVETFVECLKKKGLWKQMQTFAQEIMQVHPCGTVLNRNLENAEKLESESGIHKYSLDLILILECAIILYGDFEKKNLEDDKYTWDIFYDTMKDITYKVHECQEIYGVTGIFVGFWYDGFFDMTRFALGRLQFEMMPLSLSRPVVISDIQLEHGMEAINMHIPSSGPLTREEAEHSLELASEFFKENFDGDRRVFVMSSWLLDEDLISVLPEGNVKDFTSRFQVLTTNKSNYFDDGWRVFGSSWCFDRESWRECISNIPRTTRLQKAIADYLQQGGNLGYGYGVIVK